MSHQTLWSHHLPIWSIRKKNTHCDLLSFLFRLSVCTYMYTCVYKHEKERWKATKNDPLAGLWISKTTVQRHPTTTVEEERLNEYCTLYLLLPLIRGLGLFPLDSLCKSFSRNLCLSFLGDCLHCGRDTLFLILPFILIVFTIYENLGNFYMFWKKTNKKQET